MITKECKITKKCCFYASDFHLEMILLPYIKEKINESNFIIITQNDLRDSIKILLDRVNIKDQEKENILNLNWNKSNIVNEDNIENFDFDNKSVNIIINGDYNYIQKTNDKLKILSNNSNNSINIIDCFNISDQKLDINIIKNKYKEVLNTCKI